MGITEFLLARIAEDEAVAQAATPGPWTQGSGVTPHVAKRDWVELENQATISHDVRPTDAAHIARHDPARVLAECAAKRAIIKQHEDWPTLIQRESPMETLKRTGSINDLSFTMTQQIMWLTEREYVNRFGEEPPTAPMIRTLAAVYADHPDYQQEWAHG